ncbi:MAG: hypothetical protein E2O61_02505 [Gammaproteobacteria bacterium]|nr:MAG: hypothetical protein E2O59_10110 [Gammaproteobacteria bacterium]TDJ39608.1 MAG: hypothetical protein E2O61_02505 [Gammaproteobacteria bacterium]
MSAAEVLFIDVLDRLANASLNLDPQSVSRLEQLEGRMLRLEGEMPKDVSDRIFTLKVEGGRLSLYPHALPEPNVIVKGKLVDLSAWLLSRGSTANVVIVGDETVLQELIDLVRNFAPDLGKPLSTLLGSRAAEDLLGAVELAFAAFRSVIEGAGTAIKESAAARYADEARLNALLDGIDNVRTRADRITVRIRAEETRRQQSP